LQIRRHAALAAQESVLAGKSEVGALLPRLLLVVGVLVLVAALWRMREVLLLAFAAALLGTLLRTVADFLAWHARLPGGAAYGLAILLLLVLLGAAAWIFGAQASAQVNALAERLPQALAAVQGWLDKQPWARAAMQSIAPGSGTKQIAAHLSVVALTGFDMAAALVLVLFGGVYFGAQPTLYRHGVVLLFPPALHQRAGEAFALAGYAMRRWLLGQLVDMALIGAMTGAGLWAIGAPSPFALGLLSGLAAFVPYVGAIAAGALAVLVSATQSLQLGLETLVLYLAVEQIEGHLIMPFVQRWTIALPPALGVFAVVAMGYLLGPLGLLLATPLTVVLFVLVKKLYLQDTLGEQVAIRD
jgi:predicted PurR-regulated permease PerM